MHILYHPIKVRRAKNGWIFHASCLNSLPLETLCAFCIILYQDGSSRTRIVTLLLFKLAPLIALERGKIVHSLAGIRSMIILGWIINNSHTLRDVSHEFYCRTNQSNSDVIFCLQLLSKTLTCTLRLN